MLSILTILMLAYLLGSVSPSLLIGRWYGGIDIREHGSRNPGGTNVLRTLGWKPGIAVILLDAVKGLLAVLLVARIRLDRLPLDGAAVGVLAGSAAMLGHVWPVWARFRGGKGVATGAGVLLAVNPVAFAASALVYSWLLFRWRFVSVASVGSAVAVPLVLGALRTAGLSSVPWAHLIFAVSAAVLIVFTHRSNIGRLIRGEEPTVGRSQSRRRTD